MIKNTRESIIAENKKAREQLNRGLAVKNTKESLVTERKFINNMVGKKTPIKLKSGKTVTPTARIPGGFRATTGPNRPSENFSESDICRDEQGRFASC
jgi:hypothetical protein